MAESSTLGAALDWARAWVDAVDARVLLCAVAGCRPATLAAFRERELPAGQWLRFRALVERRRAGTPVAYLTAEREFYSRRFRVGEGVLIPRPETELLVEEAVKRTRGKAGLRVLDLGTGSGVLAVTLALELGAMVETVLAIDSSRVALGYAAWNAGALGARVDFRQGDWLDGLDAGLFDLIVSNPPYVRDDDPHLGQGDLRFEPRAALAAGTDGLDDIGRIVADARGHLAPGALLLVEHGYDQAATVRQLMIDAAYEGVESVRDLAGIERVSLARRGAVRLDRGAAGP